MGALVSIVDECNFVFLVSIEDECRLVLFISITGECRLTLFISIPENSRTPLFISIPDDSRKIRPEVYSSSGSEFPISTSHIPKSIVHPCTNSEGLYVSSDFLTNLPVVSYF